MLYNNSIAALLRAVLVFMILSTLYIEHVFAETTGYWRFEFIEQGDNSLLSPDVSGAHPLIIYNKALGDNFIKPYNSKRVVSQTYKNNENYLSVPDTGGDIHGEIEHYDELDSESITVEFWLKTAENNAIIMRKSSNNDVPDGFMFDLKKHKDEAATDPVTLRLRYRYINSSNESDLVEIRGVLDPQKDWHHVAWTYGVDEDSEKVYSRIYINGYLTKELIHEPGSKLHWTNNKLLIGYYQEGGGIDELRISDKALKQQQLLTALINPVGSWSFDRVVNGVIPNGYPEGTDIGVASYIYNLSSDLPPYQPEITTSNNSSLAGIILPDSSRAVPEVSAYSALNSDSITIGMWLKPEASMQAGTILQRLDNAGLGLLIESGATGLLKATFTVNGETTPRVHISDFAMTRVNEWQYIAWSYSAETGESCFYLNDEESCEASAPQTLNWGVGVQKMSLIPGFSHTLLDELNIYPVALSSRHMPFNVPTKFETIPLDYYGRPGIQWHSANTKPADFRVWRLSKNGATSCLDGRIIHDNWCLLKNPDISLNNGIYQFVDSPRLDPATIDEYQYRVSTIDSTFQLNGWAANGSYAPNDPIGDWLATLSDINLSRNDIPLPSEVPKLVPVGGGGNNYWLFSNNQYIALFSSRGALVSLIHRTYGIQFINNSDYRTVFGGSTLHNWEIYLGNHRGVKDAVKLIEGRYFDTENIDLLEIDGRHVIAFRWKNVKSFDMDVTTYWWFDSNESSGLHASIWVDNRGSKGILKTRFPKLHGLGYPNSPGGNYTVYLPTSGWGEKTIEPSKEVYGDYLNTSFSMQFMALESENSVLYFAAEDKQMRPKFIQYDPTGSADANTSSSSFEFYPYGGDSTVVQGTGIPGNDVGSNMELGDDSNVIDVVIAPMPGNWVNAAKRYRQFAQKQIVNEVQPLAERSTLLEKDKKGRLWWTVSYYPTSTPIYDELTGIKSVIGPTDAGDNIDVGFHLYNWHQMLDSEGNIIYNPNGSITSGFDRWYPFYAPKEGLLTSETSQGDLDRLENDGTVVMPYINGSLTDISDRIEEYSNSGCESSNFTDLSGKDDGWWEKPFPDSISEIYLKNHILLTPESEDINKQCAPSYDSKYSSGHILTKMNMASPVWRDIISDQAEVILNDMGTDAIYLDSFGGGYMPHYWYDHWHQDFNGISENYNNGHNQEWLNGARTLAEQVKNSKSYDTALVGIEHFSEWVIGYADISMLYADYLPETVPMIAAVYSDYHMFAGPRVFHGDSDQARTMKLGRGFLWGSQTGLFNLNQICETPFVNACDTDKPGIRYAKSLVRIRQLLADYLAYGEYLGSANNPASDKLVAVWCKNDSCSKSDRAELPAVQAARWLDRTGKPGIIVTNTSIINSLSETIPIPPNLRGVAMSICEFTENSENELDKVCYSSVSQEKVSIELESLETKLIQFE